MEFEVNGKKAPPGDFGEELGKVLQKAAREKITRAVRRVRCPVHGHYAKIELVGTDLKISGCCEALIERVKKSFK